jgi:hypothetical protein
MMIKEESLPEGDSERLGGAVFALVRAGKRSMPAAAVTWLQEQPSHSRLAIALSVLFVTWSRSSDVPPLVRLPNAPLPPH